MKLHYFYFALLILIFVSSCKKQKDVTIDKTNTLGGKTFTPMTVGSYWIYDVSIIDSLNITFIMFDSTYIESDTMLNGEIYYVFKSSSSPIYVQFLRDSAKYLVDEKGQKFFHPVNINDTLYKNVLTNYNNDTINFTYRIIRIPPGPTHCIAGVFNTLDAESTRYIPFLNIKTKSHYFYTPDIGLVLRQDFPIFGKTTTYNLVRYHIEQ